MTARRTALIALLALAAFGGLYGVGRAGTEDDEAASPRSASVVGKAPAGRPVVPPARAKLPGLRRAPRPAAPAPRVVASPPPVARAPAPAPAPAPTPEPAPKPEPDPGVPFFEER